MLEVDGGEKSGSGTILRLSVALAAIRREELHIYNVRGKRSPPGLRPQHLEAVLTAARLCGAGVEGATLGSRELWFRPGEVVGGDVEAEIGTAGSIPMLLLTVLPICVFAKRAVRLRVVKGGTDVRNAPTINYLRLVLLPMLRRMGVNAAMTIHRYGYYPVGMGKVSVEVQPCARLKPLRVEEFGGVEEIRGFSVCTYLKERRVAERQAAAAGEYLRARGYEASFELLYDESNPLQRGSSIVLWAATDRGALLGGDAIGELRKQSEAVGREAAENILRELDARATVDTHLADMLIPYAALADGESAYLTRSVTEHLETNIWLAREILGARFTLSRAGSLYRVEKR